MRAVFAAVLLAMAQAGRADAQTPYLVDDLNEVTDPRSGTEPIELTASGSTLYFVGQDDANGIELYRSDGTPAGTRLIMDLDPWDGSIRPQELAGAAGGVFFLLGHPNGLLDLWTSDGTVAGTRFVMSVQPVLSGTFDFVSLGPLVFFRAMNGPGAALWRSDGTPSGTYVVKGGDAEELTAAGNAIYFRSITPGAGLELWRSDGTVAGTALVRDICPGACSGYPTGLAAVGDQVFFAAQEPATGNELWKSDGTTAGTTLVRDLNPGTSNTSMAWLTNVAGTLFFGATTGTESGLWKSDGTTAGTVLVHPVSASNLTAVGTNVFFLGADQATGTELWVSDGTAAGTHLVADICPGSCDVVPRFETEPLVASGNLVFLARRWISFDQAELWRSDGTAAGTFPIRAWEGLGELESFAGSLVFAGDDGVNGQELWRTDGTPAGTAPLTARVYDSSFPRYPIAVGERLFFGADEPSVGSELWSTAGTAPTTAVLDLLPGPFTSSPYIGTAIGDRLLFAARTDPAWWGVWSTDGTMAGSQQLLQASAVVLDPLAKAAGVAIFGAGRAEDYSGAEPWRSDGSTAGTSLIEELVPGGAGSEPTFLASRGDTVFFRATAPCGTCIGLWRTDGTAQGTAQVVSGFVAGPAILRETLFFSRFETATGIELWASDGTFGGTRLVKDIVPGPESSAPRSQTAAGNLVFFLTSGPTPGGDLLWRSDGTEAGTYLIMEFSPGPPAYTDPFRLTEMNGLLYFVADDGVHGRELWRSDGTPAGTWMVKDIWPGPGSALTDDDFTPAIVAAGGRLFVAAYTPPTGIELWQSDGTSAGTVALGEIAPGAPSSAPILLGSAGPRAYFTAHDGLHGWEPWAVDLPPALSVQDFSIDEGDAGTQDVVFAVRLSKPTGQPVTVAYATADRSAVAPADYLPRSGTLTFAAGSVGPLLVPVPVLGDLQDEADESFVLDLASPAGAVLADAQAAAVVLDDDAPAVQVANVAVTEGDSGLTNADFVATITTSDGSATAAPKIFTFATEALTASSPEDFDLANGSITFPTGTPSGGTAIVRVTVRGDTADEPDETFQVRLTPASDTTGPIAPATGTILDDDGPASSRPIELAHGMSVRTDLAATAGPDRDWYLMRQQPYASYEIVVDETSGDVGPLRLRRWGADGTTVLQSGAPTGSGPSVSIRWENATEAPIEGEHVSVESGGCGTDCGADDTYRVRAYETTLAIPRLNTTGGQSTFVILQNRSDHAISGHVWLWSPGGYLWFNWTEAFTLGPRAVQVLQPLGGIAGSMTVTHDGGYGELAGKAVSLDPATGFSFDTPARPRAR